MSDKKDWGWIKEHMPETVRLLGEYRAAEGEHLDECWRRGVVHGEPGWFFAREGAVCLGTPFDLEFCDAAHRAQTVVLLLAPLPDGSECRRLNRREREAQQIAQLRQVDAARRNGVLEMGWVSLVASLAAEGDRLRQLKEGAAHGAH